MLSACSGPVGQIGAGKRRNVVLGWVECSRTESPDHRPTAAPSLNISPAYALAPVPGPPAKSGTASTEKARVRPKRLCRAVSHPTVERTVSAGQGEPVAIADLTRGGPAVARRICRRGRACRGCAWELGCQACRICRICRACRGVCLGAWMPGMPDMPDMPGMPGACWGAWMPGMPEMTDMPGMPGVWTDPDLSPAVPTFLSNTPRLQ